MSFADWKKRSNLLSHVDIWNRTSAENAARAAYKAGERDGRKRAEEMAKRAIELNKLMAGRNG